MAATVIGAGQVMEFWSVVSVSATSGATAAGMFGLVRAVLFAVGVILVWIFTEEPLEE